MRRVTVGDVANTWNGHKMQNVGQVTGKTLKKRVNVGNQNSSVGVGSSSATTTTTTAAAAAPSRVSAHESDSDEESVSEVIVAGQHIKLYRPGRERRVPFKRVWQCVCAFTV